MRFFRDAATLLLSCILIAAPEEEGLVLRAVPVGLCCDDILLSGFFPLKRLFKQNYELPSFLPFSCVLISLCRGSTCYRCCYLVHFMFLVTTVFKCTLA